VRSVTYLLNAGMPIGVSAEKNGTFKKV
jgi:hypothetical protein